MPFEIVPSGTHIDFIGKRYFAFALSALMLLVSLAAIPLQGVRLGIDFAGGTEVQLRFPADAGADEARIREVITACGVTDASVVRYGEADASEFLIRFREGHAEEAGPAGSACPLSDEERERLAKVDAAIGAQGNDVGTAALVDRFSLALARTVAPPEILRVEFVGPRVGGELRRDGLLAIGIACLLILIYIAFRFSARFAPGAVVALVHDVLITAGIFVILGLEFDLRVLAALLAIIGYSLNDTIIIYDRIRENMAVHTRHDLVDVLNRSVNETLSRTLLTSLTTLGAVGMLLLVGGEVIRPFALAMALGIVVGTYSSTFVAAPTLLFLERRFGDAGAATAVRPRAKPPAAPAPRTAEERPAQRKRSGSNRKPGRSGKRRRAR